MPQTPAASEGRQEAPRVPAQEDRRAAPQRPAASEERQRGSQGPAQEDRQVAPQRPVVSEGRQEVPQVPAREDRQVASQRPAASEERQEAPQGPVREDRQVAPQRPVVSEDRQVAPQRPVVSEERQRGSQGPVQEDRRVASQRPAAAEERQRSSQVPVQEGPRGVPQVPGRGVAASQEEETRREELPAAFGRESVEGAAPGARGARPGVPNRPFAPREEAEGSRSGPQPVVGAEGGPGVPPGSFGRRERPRISAVEGEQGFGRAPERSVWPGAPNRERLPEPVRGEPVKPEPPRIVPPPPQRRDELPPPPREGRSGPASPMWPRPMPLRTPPVERVQAITPPDQPVEEPGGLRRLLSRGNPVDQDYIERLQRPFQGTRHIVVLGCTGGAGQTVTTLMMGHTFAQFCGEPTVALDVNPGHGALARRTKIDTHETLTSLIANAEHIGSLSGIRRYTSRARSGLDVVAAGKTPLHALDDRDYAQAIRTLDRFYSVTLLDAAASVVSRVLPHADQIVLVAPASSDAPRAVAMTFEWLDSHGYHDLRQRAVTVINGVSRRSHSDVEHAEQVARGQCRALVRIPWDDHLSLDRSPRNELKALRPPTRRAYLALSAVVAGGFSVLPERYQDPSPYHQERTQ
ncbi:hypothetical protein GCM10009550_79170 [Actinocorallia libanotica]|uniref:MinD-like ATPase involved in chromosome partitioning or flagellar assembly n=1 Tax=Actinocorallia libanotica TaxID=46162 RepID=A0ABP4CMY4_9ACTN